MFSTPGLAMRVCDLPGTIYPVPRTCPGYVGRYNEAKYEHWSSERGKVDYLPR